MTGHVRQRSPGTWELRYRIGNKVATQTVRSTKRQANEKLRELLTAVDHGAKAAPSRESCEAWFERWLDALDPDLSPMTARLYRAHVDRYLTPLFGTVRLRDLDRGTIRAGWAKLDLARSTKNTVHRVLSASLGQAVEDGVIRINPAAGWRRDKKAAAVAQREKPEQAILVPAEIERLIELVRHGSMFAPTILGLGLGCRRGEAAALTWRRINIDTGNVAIREALKELSAADLRVGLTKSGAKRDVRLPASYLDLLRQWKRRQAEELLLLGMRAGPDTPVCTRPDGRRLSPNQITDLFTHIAGRLGRPDVHYHSLRHSHASILLAAGEPIASVQRRLGHGQPSTTLNVYGHAIPRDDRNESERLDAILKGRQ
jgi:integrase